MKSKTSLSWLSALLISLTSVPLGLGASSVTVVVNGASGPWDTTLNPSYPYGIFSGGEQSHNLPPTVVDASSGLAFAPGDQISIASLTPGQLTLIAGAGHPSDAGGIPDIVASNHGPEQYIGTNILLEELIGTFATNGVIVGRPFAIGNGPTSVIIPPGANELLLGVDDDWYIDNGGSVSVSVTETAVVPTVLDFWVQQLDVSLLAVTSGLSLTNGSIVDLTNDTTRLNVQSLLRAIDGKTVLAIGRPLTNFTTAKQLAAQPLNVAYTLTFTNTPDAKLVLLVPLSEEEFRPFVAVCLGPKAPGTYYSIDDYLRISTVAFDARTTNATLSSGRLNEAKGSASLTTTSIRRFTFNSNTFADAPPTGTCFDVQGLTTERDSDLVERGRITASSVARGAISSVAGTGQIGSTNAFSILRGTIILSNGRHMVQ